MQEPPAFLEGDALTQLMPRDVTALRNVGQGGNENIVSRVPGGDGVGASAVSLTDYGEQA